MRFPPISKTTPSSSRQCTDWTSSAIRASAGRSVRCLDDTLARTIRPMPDGTAFVVTGDIPAMWLRDSSTQMMPYLALVREDTALQELLLAVLRRQFQQIAHNPYANAFNAEPTGQAHDPGDLCADPWVWRRSTRSTPWPSLSCWPTASGWRPDEPITLPLALRTARTVIAVWRTEQDHERLSAYRFLRRDCPPSDTLQNAGRGTPVARTGMTWSGFRPSDDACRYGYNIPANLCAAAALDGVAELGPPSGRHRARRKRRPTGGGTASGHHAARHRPPPPSSV